MVLRIIFAWMIVCGGVASADVTKLPGAVGHAHWSDDGAWFLIAETSGDRLLRFDANGKAHGSVDVRAAAEQASFDLSAPAQRPHTLSPDGKRLLFVGMAPSQEESKLFALDLASGRARELASSRRDGMLAGASWLDDRRVLVTAFAGRALPAVDVIDTSTLVRKRFTEQLAGALAAVRVEPRVVVLAADFLYLADADGRLARADNRHLLGPADHPIAFASSPSRKALAVALFDAANPVAATILFVEHGSEATRVGQIAELSWPAWLDDNRLLYEVDRGAPDRNHTLMIYSIKDGTSRPAIAPKEHCSDGDPSASPRGGVAVFQRACLDGPGFAALVR
jgi:dipeptidyl aminopeptidase/acylaminoacyl peptidase